MLDRLSDLPFREFEFHGYAGKRRVLSFGWQFDFEARTLRRVDDIPDFLHPLRERAAGFAGVPVDALQHALLTEYPAGAAIGWHKDKAVFGTVIGISLLASCLFRLRRPRQDGWERSSLQLERRSVYLLDGPARLEWEHSIPPVETRRFSVTFRTLSDPSPGR